MSKWNGFTKFFLFFLNMKNLTKKVGTKVQTSSGKKSESEME